jgi:hypothetical protein
MSHFYERNIIEIKNEYTTFLINIMSPLLYEGVKSMYLHAVKLDEGLVEKAKTEKVNNPGVLNLFQICLKDVPNLNNDHLEKEADRIKFGSKCSEWFDDLVKAVMKSNIVLLTFNTTGKTCDIVREKHHEKIESKDFIHKCYIECARIFYNNPELFYHKYTHLELKRNQRDALNLVKVAINEAIRKMLPMKLILNEFLMNDYIKERNNITTPMSDSHYTNIRNLAQRDLAEDDNPDTEQKRQSDMNGFEEVDSDTKILCDDEIDNKLKSASHKLDLIKELNGDKLPEVELPVLDTEAELKQKLASGEYVSNVNIKKSKDQYIKENLTKAFNSFNERQEEKKEAEKKEAEKKQAEKDIENQVAKYKEEIVDLDGGDNNHHDKSHHHSKHHSPKDSAKDSPKHHSPKHHSPKHHSPKHHSPKHDNKEMNDISDFFEGYLGK